jgi:hypothetical protein
MSSPGVDTMRYRSLSQAVTVYFNALSHHRRCLNQAQQDVCNSWIAACIPAFPLEEQALQQQLDQTLLASVALLQVQADGQCDLQRMTEQWLGSLYETWVAHWETPDYPLGWALQWGDTSCGSMARVSRQVGHFAVTRMGAAALDVRRAWRKVPMH